jgi:hypothetical protein
MYSHAAEESAELAQEERLLWGMKFYYRGKYVYITRES